MARQLEDLSRSPHSLEQDRTIIAVIEMSQAHWLVAGIVPGIMLPRVDLDRLSPADLKELVIRLMETVAGLEHTVAAQREEIARLRGLKGPPSISRAGWSRRARTRRRRRIGESAAAAGAALPI